MLSSPDKKIKSKRARLNPDIRRQRLLDIAITVTAKSGLGRARHTDIAKLSSVAVSTVFFYFPSVGHLNDAIIGEVEKVVDSIFMIQTIDIHNKGSLKSILDNYKIFIEQITRNNKDYAIIFLEWSNSVNNPLWSRFLDLRSSHISFARKSLLQAELQGELKDNIDIDVISIMLSSMIVMIFKMKCYGDCDTAINEVYKCISNHIFK